MKWALVGLQETGHSHEVINLGIIEELILRCSNSEISLYGSKEYLSNLMYHMPKDYAHLINLIFLKKRKRKIYSPMNVLAEFRVLLQLARKYDQVIILSVTPTILFSLYLLQLKLMKEQKHSQCNFHLLYHGILKNLLSNRLRPDPYFRWNGFVPRISPFRFLFQIRRGLSLAQRIRLPIWNYVFSKTVLDQLTEEKKNIDLKFDFVIPPIFRFANNLNGSGTHQVAYEELRVTGAKFGVYILGRVMEEDCYELSREISSTLSNRRNLIQVPIFINFGSCQKVDVGNVFSFLDLTKRENMIENILPNGIILLLRSKQEKLGISGVVHELVAFDRPGILPDWVDLEDYGIQEPCPSIVKYRDLEELGEFLTNSELIQELKHKAGPLKEQSNLIDMILRKVIH